MQHHEVAIVGAGAAGLAAARALRALGHDVVVIEARNRIGGRVLTRRVPGFALPIELGAEFIHGDAPATMRLLDQAALAACAVCGPQRRASGGRVQPAHPGEAVDRVLGRIDPSRPDESFARFLARRPGGRAGARDRAEARRFVQGFHAADIRRIGVHGIAPDEDAPPSEQALHVSRVVEGYGALMAWLARGTRVQMRTAVDTIAWRRARAELSLRTGTRGGARLAARAVIVAVPLGVLQTPPGAHGAIRLVPDPAALRAPVAGLAMGSVTRLVVGFRELPWRRLPVAARLEDVSFIHTPAGPFNVWWTMHPMHPPLAVAWSGGPPAAALAERPRADLLDIAIAQLAAALDVPRRRIATHVQHTWVHDWQHDPFARGAYSYARVGGSDAARALSRPIAGTLFVAGEHTDAEASGTVEGAIASGLRAARQVHAALRRRGAARRR